MYSFLYTLLSCSLTTTAIAAAYMLLWRPLQKRLNARLLFAIWLVIIAAFAIPWRPEITIPVQTAATPSIAQSLNIYFEVPLQASDGQVAAQGLPLVEILFYIWAVGCAAVLAGNLIKHRRFMRTVSRWSVLAYDARVASILHSLKNELDIKKYIGVKICCTIEVPMLAGFVKPTILLPEKCLHSRHLSMILRHELVHYTRRDLWSKAMMLAAASIHWFNPMIYAAVRSASLQCELACDEQVMNGRGKVDKNNYTAAILEAAGAKRIPAILTTNLYGGMHEMKARLSSLFDMKKKRKGVVALCLVLALTMCTGVVFAKEAPPSVNLPDPPSAAEPQSRGEAVGQIQYLPAAQNADTTSPVKLSAITLDEADIQYVSNDTSARASNPGVSQQPAPGNESPATGPELPVDELIQPGTPDDPAPEPVPGEPEQPVEDDPAEQPDDGQSSPMNVYASFADYGISFDPNTRMVYYQGMPVRHFDADTYNYEGRTYRINGGDSAATQARISQISAEDWVNRESTLEHLRASYRANGIVDIVVLRDDRQRITGVAVTIFEYGIPDAPDGVIRQDDDLTAPEAIADESPAPQEPMEIEETIIPEEDIPALEDAS